MSSGSTATTTTTTSVDPSRLLFANGDDDDDDDSSNKPEEEEGEEEEDATTTTVPGPPGWVHGQSTPQLLSSTSSVSAEDPDVGYGNETKNPLPSPPLRLNPTTSTATTTYTTDTPAPAPGQLIFNGTPDNSDSSSSSKRKRTRSPSPPPSHPKRESESEEEEEEEVNKLGLETKQPPTKKPKTLYDVITNPAERSLKTWVQSVVGSSGVGGSGSTQAQPRGGGEEEEDDDREGKRRTKRGRGGDGISFFRNYETIPHYRGKTLRNYQRLDPSGDDLEMKLESYVSPGVLSAIESVYSHYQLNPKLQHLTLRELIFGDDIHKPLVHTRAQIFFRNCVIQFFREERFNNSQRMRSVAGAKIQGMITSFIAANLRDSCGNHYQ